jgi:hypothetical protein
MEQTECSEMPAYKIQTPGNCPEESIQQSEHGGSLKSRIRSNLLHSFICSFTLLSETIHAAMCSLPLNALTFVSTVKF